MLCHIRISSNQDWTRRYLNNYYINIEKLPIIYNVDQFSFGKFNNWFNDSNDITSYAD